MSVHLVLSVIIDSDIIQTSEKVLSFMLRVRLRSLKDEILKLQHAEEDDNGGRSPTKRLSADRIDRNSHEKLAVAGGGGGGAESIGFDAGKLEMLRRRRPRRRHEKRFDTRSCRIDG
ncbi:hypothetical protein RB195_016817 [Necator americanus]|uniref:Uncharacterized protein n=1 Tax=Necator americanus TaxID=51031 RepID=A0ABR1C4I1_NECAM